MKQYTVHCHLPPTLRGKRSFREVLEVSALNRKDAELVARNEIIIRHKLLDCENKALGLMAHLVNG